MTAIWICSAVAFVAGAVGWYWTFRGVGGLKQAEHIILSVGIGMGVAAVFWFNLALAYAG